MSTLQPEQIEQYRRDGYLVLPGLVAPERLAAYDARFEALVHDRSLHTEAMVMMNDVQVVKGAVQPRSPMHAVNKLISFEEDAELYAYALEPGVTGAVRDVLGAADIYSISTNIFNKPPDVDGRHPYHQDLRYFRIRPADGIVGVWTAMLPATRASGCLSVIPGSHRGELLDHDMPDWDYVNYGFFGVDDIDTSARAHVELQPGDTLLFHPLLIHGSGRNTTQSFRRAISAHYAAASCTSPKRDWRIGKQARRIPPPR